MNWKRLGESVGKRVRLRPMPVHGRVGHVDDIWMVTSVREHPRQLWLDNTRIGHRLRIGADSVFKYRETGSLQEPGFLQLKAQVVVDGTRCYFEPLPDPRAMR